MGNGKKTNTQPIKTVIADPLQEEAVHTVHKTEWSQECRIWARDPVWDMSCLQGMTLKFFYVQGCFQ